MLKFSAEQLAGFGCKTHEELAVKLFTSLPGALSLTDTVNGFKAELKTATETITGLQTKLTATENALTAANTKIATLETSTAKPALEAIAKEQATMVLGGAAAPTHTAAPSNPTAQPAPKATSEADTLKAQGKYMEAYAALPADHQDRKDFASADRYEAYMRAIGGGKVAVFKKD